MNGTSTTRDSCIHQAEAERLKRKDWIQTFSGLPFRPLAPDPKAVRIEDIAHALSNKCRYTGHTQRFYSVAEHCVHVASLVGLPGLLHDAGEAYLPDIASPIKKRVSVDGEPFAVAEARVLDAICEALGLSAIRWQLDSDAVKEADLALLAAEVRVLLDPPPANWGLTVSAADVQIGAWEPRDAERQFLAVWRRLMHDA